MQEPLKSPTRRAARNEMDGFLLGVFAWVFLRISSISTKRNVKLKTDLIESQGKIKK